MILKNKIFTCLRAWLCIICSSSSQLYTVNIVFANVERPAYDDVRCMENWATLCVYCVIGSLLCRDMVKFYINHLLSTYLFLFKPVWKQQKKSHPFEIKCLPLNCDTEKWGKGNNKRHHKYHTQTHCIYNVIYYIWLSLGDARDAN